MKQVCQLDAAGYFTGMTTADESPLELGVFLIPAGAVDVPIPTIPEGQRAKWVGEWAFEDAPKPEPELNPEPEPTPPTPEEEAEILRMKRQTAYEQEADPLFFKYQRGEVEQQVWLDKVAEIKARYPKE